MKAQDLITVSKNSPVVAFHKFVLLCKGRDKDLFCFFEGLDSQYYSLRIKQYVSRKYHSIYCGNKQTVINAHALLKSKSEYNNYFKCFFVDIDFDERINNSEIYETPYYSIENFYVNDSTLHEILINEFKLSVEDKEYKEIMSLFESELEMFNESTLLFNAWYAALKQKMRVENLPSTNVNLDEKMPKDFVCIKIGTIKSEYDFKLIKERFPDALEITEEQVQKKINELKKENLCHKLRGKYLLWFFYSFLQFLIKDANSNKTILKSKTKFNVDKAQIHSQLSQYAVTTSCLIDYLSQFN